MPRTIYALMVGINSYPDSIPNLKGCVNDVTKLNSFLSQRIKQPVDLYEPLILINEQATRAAIIDGFRNHLHKASGDDVALFYYSGHGSQEISPKEFWHLEPDRLDETLVCYDSRKEGGWDLADKELSLLISEVAANNAHVFVILDCCHSGGGTRAFDEDIIRIRLAKNDTRIRPIFTFILSPKQLDELAKNKAQKKTSESSNWISISKGRHIVFSACRANEPAKECQFGEEIRGAFSFFLLETLQRTNAFLTYRDVFKKTNALVRAQVSQQSPQMEATFLTDLEQPFLGGTICSQHQYFTMSFDGKNWVIDGGIVHGIKEKTRFAIFPYNYAITSKSNLIKAIGYIEIQTAFPGHSIVFLISTQTKVVLTASLTYKAIPTTFPIIPLVVSLQGENKALQKLRNAMDVDNYNQEPSLLVRIGELNKATLKVEVIKNQYRISRIGDNSPLLMDVPINNLNSVQLVIQRLEHIARWLSVIQLTNNLSRIPLNAVQIEIVILNDNNREQSSITASEVRLEQRKIQGNWEMPRFKIRLKNTSDIDLYCILLDLPETYSISPMLPGGGIWLEPSQETFVIGNDGSPILYQASIPDFLWEKGLIEIKDTLKLIASTEEIDATLLVQDDLPVDFMPRNVTHTITPTNTLNYWLYQLGAAGTRHITMELDTNQISNDWMTSEVSFTTYRPQEIITIPDFGLIKFLNNSVEVMGHPQLKAEARLSNINYANRQLNVFALPPILTNNSCVIPFEFVKSRECGGQGLSVLELFNVQDFTVVSQKYPLVIKTKTQLAKGEYLLPVAFDGEFYLPLGFACSTPAGTEINLERLPKPIVDNKNLAGSIKIFFHKIISDHVGLPNPYPVLAAAVFSKEGRITYIHDKREIRQKVSKASRLLLFIHGIIGSTKSMIEGMRNEKIDFNTGTPSLISSYDLVLTFDYENIHTTIESNAQQLKQRLEEVGLSTNHGKTLFIIAHSMGGLISRWFIEQEGGNKIVQHLIMLGTPNAGCPWPMIQDWVTLAIGIGLNGLSAIAWPASILANLVSALEVVDIAFDQLKPNSDLLKKLAASFDPHVPYTLIAGNTSIISSALEEKENSLFARLWNKLMQNKWLYHLTNFAFFGSPNDLAVSVNSIHNIPANRLPQPELLPPIPCDHLTYFNSKAGLTTLTRILLSVYS